MRTGLRLMPTGYGEKQGAPNKRKFERKHRPLQLEDRLKTLPTANKAVIKFQGLRLPAALSQVL